MENNAPKPDEPAPPRRDDGERGERARRDDRDERDRDERRPRRRRDEEDDYDDRPRRPRRRDDRDEFEATDLIIPTNVSVWSMLACYLGIFGCLIPFLGFFMGILAIIFGFVAFKKKKKRDSYGAVTGDIRAVVGIICGALTIIGYLVVIVISLMNQK